jgi:hypothetical protein
LVAWIDRAFAALHPVEAAGRLFGRTDRTTDYAFRAHMLARKVSGRLSTPADGRPVPLPSLPADRLTIEKTRVYLSKVREWAEIVQGGASPAAGAAISVDEGEGLRGPPTVARAAEPIVGPRPPPLTRNECAILLCLANSKQGALLFIEDIAAAATAELQRTAPERKKVQAPLSRKAAGACLGKLEKMSLVDRPRGKRAGWTITPAGAKAASQMTL